MIHLELSPRNNEKGFTLIETLIYAAITTAVIAFSILATYQLIESSDRGRNQRELVENQKLLEQKIYWMLQGVSNINTPSAGATSTILSVDKISFAANPLVMDVEASTTRLKIGSAAPVPVTNDAYVAVQDLRFHQFDFSGQPAIRISGNLFNAYTSTTVALDTTIIVK